MVFLRATCYHISMQVLPLGRTGLIHLFLWCVVAVGLTWGCLSHLPGHTMRHYPDTSPSSLNSTRTGRGNAPAPIFPSSTRGFPLSTPLPALPGGGRELGPPLRDPPASNHFLPPSAGLLASLCQWTLPEPLLTSYPFFPIFSPCQNPRFWSRKESVSLFPAFKLSHRFSLK